MTLATDPKSVKPEQCMNDYPFTVSAGRCCRERLCLKKSSYICSKKHEDGEKRLKEAHEQDLTLNYPDAQYHPRGETLPEVRQIFCHVEIQL